MKKILFSLVALVCSMSMNAQVMKVMKNGEEVAKYNGTEYSVVFEEEQVSTEATGTAKATINGSEVDVAWVQLWENGPKFAEYNVGVTDGKIESYGGYYFWGSSIDKDKYGAYKEGAGDLTGSDDTATKLWGSNWRMPTQAELQGLLDNCDVEWTTVNGVNGNKFTGKEAPYKSSSVFIPAAGRYFYEDDEVRDQGSIGLYWSSTSSNRYENNAYELTFVSSFKAVQESGCSWGSWSVRAVLAED